MRRQQAMKTTAVAALTMGLAALTTVGLAGTASAAPASASAARSTAISVHNETGCDFYRIGQSLDHGIWTTEVPELVKDGNWANWASESNGFMTGTEGRAFFQTGNCANTSLNYKRIELHWDNPFVGSNNYGEQGDSFSFTREGGKGNNTSVSWKIRGK
ncbi:hypothetical protein [Streptomyces sp. NPDC049555]|uniref:hypothetical protein n=1 Tax=Streptomyces sp. NPDC049555 TaxID=3154930 RepID=UPI00342E9115